ncbi:MAG TPA: hypothetical protein PKY56_09630 [Candidatus Kapabacteria bacterium]|nr:hypothetical protein [Candidatus Kapabacteria bacterium]
MKNLSVASAMAVFVIICSSGMLFSQDTTQTQERNFYTSNVFAGYVFEEDSSSKLIELGMGIRYPINDFFFVGLEPTVCFAVDSDYLNYSVSLPIVAGFSIVKNCKVSMDLLVGAGPVAAKFKDVDDLQNGILTKSLIGVGYDRYFIYISGNFSLFKSHTLSTVGLGFQYKF